MVINKMAKKHYGSNDDGFNASGLENNNEVEETQDLEAVKPKSNLFSRTFKKIVGIRDHKKTWAGVRAGIYTLAAITAFSSCYTVDESEQAVVTRFGQPVRVVINPLEGQDQDLMIEKAITSCKDEGISYSVGAGLKFKLPYIDSVQGIDRRLLRWNGEPEQIPTKDKRYLWVDTTARWNVEDPLEFYRTVGSEQQAQARLDDIIDSSVRNSVTQRDLISIVRTDNREMVVAEEELKDSINVGSIKEGREHMLQEIIADSDKSCNAYGIGIIEKGVLIKGINYTEKVKTSVEDRMIEERLRIAEKYTSEGEGEYLKIMGDKEREVKRITSEAYKESEEIRGAADAQAVKIYANSFGQDPEFYKFSKTLDLYKTSIGGEGTRLILGTDNPLWSLMKGDVDSDFNTNK